MKLLQRILIIVLLILPVILGLILLTGAQKLFPSASLKCIGLVRVEGVIYNSENIIKQLSSYRNNKNIAGILLKIDSPGGATAPSQEIYREILRIKEDKKPLVVSMGSIAASGGYYIASPARCIYAEPGTLTGSIGVILTVPLYKDLASKIGVQMRTLKAGKFKDIASHYRLMTDGEERIIQSLLDDTHDQFIVDVARAREINQDSIKAIADGRVFTGRQAQALGLVDSLGGYLEALAYLKKITGCSPNTRIIEHGDKFSTLRELLVEEIVHIFPQLYSFIAPSCMNYLFYLD